MPYASSRPNGARVEAPVIVDFRKYKEEDKKRAVEIYVAGFFQGVNRITRPVLYSAVKKWTDGIKPQYDDVDTMMSVNNGGCLFSVVNEDGEVIGTVGIRVSDDDKCRNRAEIVRMALTEQYQGKGIGRLMMEFILEYARINLKCETVWLLTGTTLVAACKLYEKFGFIEVSREQEGDTSIGAVEVWWSLIMERKL